MDLTFKAVTLTFDPVKPKTVAVIYSWIITKLEISTTQSLETCLSKEKKILKFFDFLV
jgi:hypothetical protein